MKRIVKKPDERKDELLEIALKLFLTQGFEDTSVKEIYSQANGSFGMFYHHFESKEAIFTEAMSRYVGKFIANISAVSLDADLSFRQRYIHLIGLYIEFLDGRDRVCGYKRTEMDMTVFRRLSLDILNASIPVIQKFLEVGRDAGLLAFDDPEVTATFLIYGVYGMVRKQSLAEAHNKNAAAMLRKLSPFIAGLLGAELSLLQIDITTMDGETENE